MKRFKFLLKKDDKIKLSILLLLLLISTFLEFIGIGSIPIFVSIIFNPDYLSQKFPFLDEYNIFKNLDRNKSILMYRRSSRARRRCVTFTVEDIAQKLCWSRHPRLARLVTFFIVAIFGGLSYNCPYVCT